MQPTSKKPGAPKIVLMDVYETLLDMSEIEKSVNRLMDARRGYIIWFELFMQYCFVDNCIGQFNNFASIAAATMKMTGKMLGTTISNSDVDGVLELLKHLPVHANVQEGLSELNTVGMRVAALTNSPASIVLERMERTGLISYFETVLSAEAIKKYKPCIEVYAWAAETLEVLPNEILLVSAHGWDIAGGVNAGLQTAYLKQDKQMLYPLAPEPNYVCNSLIDLAKQFSKQNEL